MDIVLTQNSFYREVEFDKVVLLLPTFSKKGVSSADAAVESKDKKKQGAKYDKKIVFKWKS